MEIWFVDAMAFFFFVDGGADIFGDLLVGSPPNHHRFNRPANRMPLSRGHWFMSQATGRLPHGYPAPPVARGRR